MLQNLLIKYWIGQYLVNKTSTRAPVKLAWIGQLYLKVELAIIWDTSMDMGQWWTFHRRVAGAIPRMTFTESRSRPLLNGKWSMEGMNDLRVACCCHKFHVTLYLPLLLSCCCPTILLHCTWWCYFLVFVCPFFFRFYIKIVNSSMFLI